MSTGLGAIGSRISLSRSPIAKRKHQASSQSREHLCQSTESINEDEICRKTFKDGNISETGLVGDPMETKYGTVEQIREAKMESIGLWDFMKKTFSVLGSTGPTVIGSWKKVTAGLCLFLLSAMPIAMMVVGGTYKNECPKEVKLPIYLLVGGGFGMLKLLFIIIRKKTSREYERLLDDNDDDEPEDQVLNRSVKFTNFLLTIFLSTWFVVGNVWLYRIWIPNFEQPLHEPKNWCSYVLYWFTFYQFLVTYCLLAVFCIIVAIIVVVYLTDANNQTSVV